MAAKRGNRRKSSGRARNSSKGSLLPWYAGALLAVGGIVAYDHWGDLKPRLAATERVATASISSRVPAQKPPPLALMQAPKTRTSSLPVPPASIPVVPVSVIPAAAPKPSPAPAPSTASESFGFCGDGPHFNCVMDGNTFWVRGAKIRIADIDTPQINPPSCAEEKNRGLAAKLRLLALLNQGAFTLQASSPDADKDGVKFRTIYRQGRSIGMQMVSEGLARPSAGSHKPWCT
jgi:endonuclease YncB( thermonuclease family)